MDPSFLSELPGAPDTKGGPGGTILDAAIADAIVSLDGPKEGQVRNPNMADMFIIPSHLGKLV